MKANYFSSDSETMAKCSDLIVFNHELLWLIRDDESASRLPVIFG